jgi:transcriptional regulator with XRE-family HTH domain
MAHVRARDEQPRHELGDLLRQARTDARLTQDAIGHAIGLDRSAAARIESGERSVALTTLGAWLDRCAVTGLAESGVRAMWRVASRRHAGDNPAERVQPWHDQVARASTVRYWSPLLFPGICQTFEYARRVYEAFGHPPAEAESDARARVERQAILDADDAAMIVLMLWEAVLYHEIGGPAVMAAQCARLLELAERPGVVMHVVKHESAGLGGTISLASVQGEGDTLLLASILEDTVTSEAAQVRRAQAIFERVRSMAENATESTSIVREARSTWQGRAS